MRERLSTKSAPKWETALGEHSRRRGLPDEQLRTAGASQGIKFAETAAEQTAKAISIKRCSQNRTCCGLDMRGRRYPLRADHFAPRSDECKRAQHLRCVLANATTKPSTGYAAHDIDHRFGGNPLEALNLTLCGYIRIPVRTDGVQSALNAVAGRRWSNDRVSRHQVMERNMRTAISGQLVGILSVDGATGISDAGGRVGRSNDASRNS